MVPESQFVLMAAIVSTTPAAFAAAYICFICIFIKPCSSNMYLKDCIKGFVFTIQMFAAFVAIVGAVMFIVAAVVLGDPNAKLNDFRWPMGSRGFTFLLMDLLLACLEFSLESAVFAHNFTGVYCVVLISLQIILCSKVHTLYSLEFVVECLSVRLLILQCVFSVGGVWL